MSIVIERGWAIKAGYKEETEWGTAPDNVTYDWGDIVEIEAAVIPERELIRYLAGSRDVARIRKIRELVDLRTVLKPTQTTVMQYAITNITKSVTWWLTFTKTSKELIIPGCKANELLIRGRPGYSIDAEISWFGKTHSETAPTNATQTSDPESDPLVPPSNAVEKGGNALAKALSFEVRVRNNLERIPDWAETPKTIIEKHRDITGLITATFEDFDELTEITNDSDFTLKFKLSSTNYVEITGCKWGEYRIPARPTDLIAMRLPFTAKSITLA